jgi:hypothetical protein
MIKNTILDAKEAKKAWLQYALTCDSVLLDTVFALTEALALVEARGTEMYVRQTRQPRDTGVDK